MRTSKVHRLLSELNGLKWSVTYKGIIVGLVAGIMVTIYRLGIEFGVEKSVEIYAFLRIHPIYILPWILFVLIAGYIIYRLIKLEPYAKGSGIPQVEGIVLFGMKMKWYTILMVRFFAGLLTSFFGVSLGREGPSIQIGASCGQAISKKIGKNKLEKNYLITAGASAGLSSAFNAPLSGIVFALEEVHRSFSPNILIAVTTAALTADVTSKYFLGLSPVLSFVSIPELPLIHYVWLLLLGVISGAVGALINKGLLQMSALYGKLTSFMPPTIALLIALPIGLFLPQILGGGQNLVALSENAGASISFLLILFAAKLIFTCVCFGSNMPGGIFMPILSLGAMTGCVLGLVASRFGMSAEFIPVFCVCAMAGAMSGSVKAPVTSIILMAEMTGSLVHLLPVAAVAFIALLTSDLLRISPIYEVLLENIVGDYNVNTKAKRADSILEIPVEMGSEIAGKLVRNISLPEGVLIVSINRGQHEIIPNGETKIVHGDYLVFLSAEKGYNEISQTLFRLCRSK